MSWYQYWIALSTIARKEMVRIFRIWIQTLLPPIITTTLYFLIFGHVIGSRVGTMGGHSYIKFIAPGLIMLALVNSSYASASSSFFSNKFTRAIEEILVSPMSNTQILIGFMAGGVLRGVVVGVMVMIVTLLFTDIHIYSLPMMLLVGIVSSAIFALGGVINGIFATKFDDISLIPTFVLTPLVYLGGVFYSINLLPAPWKYISMVNPISYIISVFRYSFFGTDGAHVIPAMIAMVVIFVALFCFALHLLRRGIGMRT